MNDFGSRVASMQPLRQAASEGNFQALKRLCKEKGVKVDEAGPGSGRAALHWGALAESNEVVSYLLNAKQANVDLLDADLNTPLTCSLKSQVVYCKRSWPSFKPFSRMERTPLSSIVAVRLR